MKKEISHPIKVGFFHIMRENFSGAQRNIFRLLINLDKDNIHPVLLGQSESPLVKKIKEKKIETRIVPYPSELSVFDQKILTFNPFTLINFLKGIFVYNKELIKCYRDMKLDVIWCDNIRTFITIYFACKYLKVKIIWNIWSEPKGKVAWIIHRLGLFFSDRINIEYRNQQKKIFGSLSNLSFAKKKIIALYTGVSDFDGYSDKDIRSELCLNDDSILLVMASNIVLGKGQLDLIKSVNEIKDSFQNLKLVLAGTPVKSSPESIAYNQELIDYVKENKLEKIVYFVGWRNDIRDIYKTSDIYISTSYSESFPDAVREAMLESLPVIVTDVGGTFELVESGENGYLFEPGNISVLTFYLKKLIKNESLRIKMGIKSKKIIDERFSTKVYAKDFEEMIFNLIND